MTSSSRKSDGESVGESVAGQGTGVNVTLEIARRIALETLQADHQALELYAPTSTISLARAAAVDATSAKPLNGP